MKKDNNPDPTKKLNPAFSIKRKANETSEAFAKRFLECLNAYHQAIDKNKGQDN